MLTHVWIGSLFGSVLGGRYSDHVFRKLKAQNGGTSQAEVSCTPVYDAYIH